MNTTILDTLQRVADLFESQGLPYALMGGIAVRVYGLPRPTYDVDFALVIPRDRLPQLYQAARDVGLTVPETYLGGWVDLVAEMPLVKFRFYIGGEGIDIDLFLVESEYQRKLIERRRREEVERFSAWVVSPEDLVLMKLIAYRPRDLGDIGDVLLVQGQLDVAYMQFWADRLGVRERLDKIIAGHYDI